MEISLPLTPLQNAAAHLAAPGGAVRAPVQSVQAVNALDSAPRSNSAPLSDASSRTKDNLRTEHSANSQARDTEATRALARDAQSEAARNGGSIRFEIEEGTRVTQYFDTRDVLIYQVPPEGRVYLIKSEEASAQDQVREQA